MRVGPGWLSLSVVLLAASAAHAQGARGPAFDCTKAEGTVEELICKDAELGALDRKLDEAYKAALAKARDAMPGTLRAEQRGWVKGRNDCWKAQEGSPAFLTASWQVTSVRDCVVGSYQLRTAELQAVWQLVPSKGPVFFACENNPANEVVATFFETDLPSARLERGDRSVTAYLVQTGSGARYEGQNVDFWTKGDEAQVTWDGSALACQVRPRAQ
jgi:uncharacterized protein